MESLEYNDIQSEVRGVMTPGRLKLGDQSIVFKNNKTGKVEQINSSDIELVNSQKFVGSWGIRVFTKNGTLHRFCGFKDSDNEKVAKFFKKQYSIDMLEKELCVRGWNWGTAKFNGSVLSFDMDVKTSFEIPLNHVSQCNTGKNEVTLEFHQNDDAPVGLMEMRFHIPTSESAETDPVDNFLNNVMNKASVISVSGDAISIFREIHCLTPRGRYDIKIFSTFFQLHGKTFDYKIPMSTVLRLFLLPHKDNRQMFFVLSLDPPIKQGQTRYHFLVLLFGPEEDISIELPFSEEELKEKYDNKITKELSGPVYEVMGKIMKVLINRKITGPGNFMGHSGTPAVGCSFKAAAGYLYPLERGFIYVHKPPIHIRFEEITTVNFARSGGSTRSFDFEIELKSGTVHTFSSIEKEEYAKLFDFIQKKKLHVKNTGKNDKGAYKDDFGDSDNENEPDAYLARVKAEAREKDSDVDDDEGSEEESTDEDFKPNENESDVAEEYDSNAQSDSSDDSDASGGVPGDPESAERKEKRKEKKEKKEQEKKDRKEKVVRKTKKKDKDSNRPKRATTAFMLWLNETREEIKKDNPGIKVTEIAKKGGEMWREMKDKSKWDEKAAKDKIRYADEMKEYNAAGGAAKDGSDDEGAKAVKRKKESSKKKESPTKKSVNVSGGSFKSKEYISDDDSSSNESGGGEKKKLKKEDKESKKKSDSEADEEEEEETESSGGSGDEKKEKLKSSPTKNKPEAKVAPKKKADSDEEIVTDDEKTKTKPAAAKPKPASKVAPKKKSDSEDEPMVSSEEGKSKSKAVPAAKAKPASKVAPKKKADSEEEEEAESTGDESEEEKAKPKPKSAAAKGKPASKVVPKKKAGSEDEEEAESTGDESEKEKAKPKPKSAAAKGKPASKVTAKKKDGSEGEDEATGDDSVEEKAKPKPKSSPPKGKPASKAKPLSKIKPSKADESEEEEPEESEIDDEGSD